MLKSSKDSKIICAKCGLHWGVLMSFGDREVPLLKIVNFKFKINDKIFTYKKWKFYPFHIIESDIFNL